MIKARMKHVKWIVGIILISIFLLATTTLQVTAQIDDGSGNIVPGTGPSPSQGHFPFSSPSTAPQPVNPTGAGATAPPSTGSPAPTGMMCSDGGSVPNPYCASTAPLSLASYIAPCTGGDRNSTKCSISSASYTGKNGKRYGNLTNKVYGITGADGQQYVMQETQVSTSYRHMLYRVTPDGSIYFVEDTTGSNGTPLGYNCTEGGIAFIRNTSDTPTFPSSMTCGSTYSSSFSMQSFHYPEGEPSSMETSPMGTATPCTTKNDGGGATMGGDKQIIFSGVASCGSFTGNVVAFQTVNNSPGNGEVAFFCEGIGLCSHYQAMDFSKTDPSKWVGADICAIQAACEEEPEKEVVSKGITNEDITDVPIGVTVLNALANGVLDLGINLYPLRQSPQDIQPDLTKHDKWLLNVVPKRNAYSLQRQIVNDEKEQPTSTTSRICLLGTIDVAESKTLIESEKKEVKNLKNSSRPLNALHISYSFLKEHEQQEQAKYGKWDLNNTIEVIDPSFAPQCNEKQKAMEIKEKQDAATGLNEYIGNDKTKEGVVSHLENASGPIQTLISQILNIPVIGDILASISGIIGKSTNLNSTVKSRLHVSNTDIVSPRLTNLMKDVKPYSVIDPVSELESPHGGKKNEFKDPADQSKIIETRFQDEAAWDTQAKYIKCSSLPRELQDKPQFKFCKKIDDSQIQGNTPLDPSNTGYTADGDVIDITNKSCQLTPEAIEYAINGSPSSFKGIKLYYIGDNGKWGDLGSENFSKIAMNAYTYAKDDSSFKLNPIMLLAMSIEETAFAGSISEEGDPTATPPKSGDAPMIGCGTVLLSHEVAGNPNVNERVPLVQDHMYQQIRCMNINFFDDMITRGQITSSMTPQEQFWAMLCRWKFGDPNCDHSKIQNLAGRIIYWYKILSDGCGMIEAGSTTTPATQ